MDSFYGIFLGRFEMYWGLGLLLCFLNLAYLGLPFLGWILFFGLTLFGFKAPLWTFVALAAVGLFLGLPVLRRMFSSVIMMQMKRWGFVPKISSTEKAALEAGSVWIERDIFSGAPNYKKLMRKPYPKLSDEEKEFLNGPVERLCEMLDDWKIWKTRQIPDEVWDVLKREKFLGMIIPKAYGGLEFSAHAHSEVIMKLTSRSVPVAISTMVPNSLGPAELLIHYGTKEQKDLYLPRLADGREIPCFALTEPGAGSDAGSLTAEGVLFKGEDDLFYLKLNWNKRWITLAGIATLVGLAFRLRDPNNYLGLGEDVGITCALIPANTPGILRGRRHDPMGIPFINCPIHGKDVIVPAEKSIIGGMANAGKGWRMLMECLSAGRGISLPAQSVGGAKVITRAVGAHATVRKQFGMSISKFEGVTEVLGRIGGLTYAVDALRTLTTGALNQGMKPGVVTAITKYYSTEISRKLANDGMDILGGAGISRGPRNFLANGYITAPLGITVEGANILTRTLIIFGQGLLRAHPYAYATVESLQTSNVKNFDKAFWGQIGHVAHLAFRAPLLSLTRGRLYRSCPSQNRRYFQKLAWASASFAFTTNLAMILVGSKLKFKEALSGRFADMLAWNYIGFGVLYRHAAQGSREEDQALVDWSMKYAFQQMQEAREGIYANLSFPGLTWLLRVVLGSWVRMNRFDSKASDELSFQVAHLITRFSEARNRLTDGIFIPNSRTDGLGRLEYAFELALVAEKIEKRIRDAVRRKILPKGKTEALKQRAVELGIINAQDLKDLELAKAAYWDAIQVDDFSDEEYFGTGHEGETKGHLDMAG